MIMYTSNVNNHVVFGSNKHLPIIIGKQTHKGLISLYGNMIIVARIDVMILYEFSTVVEDVLLVMYHL